MQVQVSRIPDGGGIQRLGLNCRRCASVSSGVWPSGKMTTERMPVTAVQHVPKRVHDTGIV
ncbi:hypothetical protein KCP76_24670 [Salmonella enterica subsp. enterica serovar Weltevreden]|nr:hypothetical protein KCP76_24670 [Salmonella enterica subsp. enterica serovar Weltevreden]